MVHDLKTIIALNEIEDNFHRVEFKRYSGIPTEGVDYVVELNGVIDMANLHHGHVCYLGHDGWVPITPDFTILGELHLRESND